jgi:hypothetical protein
MAYRWRIADFAVGQFLKAQAEIIAAPQTYVSSATLTIPKAPCNAREFSELRTRLAPNCLVSGNSLVRISRVGYPVTGARALAISFCNQLELFGADPAIVKRDLSGCTHKLSLPALQDAHKFCGLQKSIMSSGIEPGEAAR